MRFVVIQQLSCQAGRGGKRGAAVVIKGPTYYSVWHHSQVAVPAQNAEVRKSQMSSTNLE